MSPKLLRIPQKFVLIVFEPDSNIKENFSGSLASTMEKRKLPDQARNPSPICDFVMNSVDPVRFQRRASN